MKGLNNTQYQYLKKDLNNTQYQYQYFERPLTIPIPIAIFQKHPNTTQYQYLTQ